MGVQQHITMSSGVSPTSTPRAYDEDMDMTGPIKAAVIKGLADCADGRVFNITGDSNETARAEAAASSGGGGGGLDPAVEFFIDVNYSTMIPILCVVGLLGNALNICVLTMASKFQSTMYLYMKYMAVSDIVVMLFWVPIVVKYGWHADPDTLSAERYYTHVGFPLINIFVAASSLLVTCITVERYLSVVHTLKWYKRTNACLAHAIAVTAILLPALLDVPVMLGKYVVEERDGCTNSTVFTVVKHDYKSSYLYEVVYNWLKVMLLSVLPVLIVAVLNVRTLNVYRKAVLERRRLTKTKHDRRRNGRPSSGKGSQKRCSLQAEQHLTLLLTGITLLFVTCMLPNAVITIMHYTIFRDNKTSLYFALRAVSNILIVMNSSLNFFVYCLSGQHFRRQLLRLFGCYRYAGLDETATIQATGTSRTPNSFNFKSHSVLTVREPSAALMCELEKNRPVNNV